MNKLIDNNCDYYYQTNERTNNDDTEDTDVYPLPRRYIRVLWVVFRGITANAGIIPEQT
jgi:hypothetical protein